MFSKPVTSSFVTAGRCQVQLEQEISISITYGDRDFTTFGEHRYIPTGDTEEKLVMVETSDWCLPTWYHIGKHQHQGFLVLYQLFLTLVSTIFQSGRQQLLLTNVQRETTPQTEIGAHSC